MQKRRGKIIQALSCFFIFYGAASLLQDLAITSVQSLTEKLFMASFLTMFFLIFRYTKASVSTS